MLDALRITEVDIPTTWPCSSNTGCEIDMDAFESFFVSAKVTYIKMSTTRKNVRGGILTPPLFPGLILHC